MPNQNRTTKEVAALILKRELLVRENKVLALMLDKLSLARKAGNKQTFAAMIAAA